MNYQEFYKEIYFRIIDENVNLADFKKYSKIISEDYRLKFGMTETWFEFHKHFDEIKTPKDKDVLLNLTSMFRILYESYNS